MTYLPHDKYDLRRVCSKILRLQTYDFRQINFTFNSVEYCVKKHADNSIWLYKYYPRSNMIKNFIKTPENIEITPTMILNIISIIEVHDA